MFSRILTSTALCIFLVNYPAVAQDSTTHENAARKALSRKDYTTAAREFEEAARQYDKEGNGFSAFQVLCSLGEAQSKAGNSLASQEAFDRALQLAKKLRNVSFEAKAEIGVGDALFLRSDYSGAQVHYQKGLTAARQANSLPDQHSALFNLATCQQNQNQIPIALKTFSEALKVTRDLNSDGGQIEILFRTAKLKLGQKDYPGAIKDYEESAKIAARSGDKENEKAAYYNMSLVYDSSGDTKKRDECLKKSGR